MPIVNRPDVKRALAAVSLGAVLLAAGCTGGQPSRGSDQAQPSRPDSSVQSPIPGRANTQGSAQGNKTTIKTDRPVPGSDTGRTGKLEHPVLADGRYPVRLKRVQVAQRTITVDVVQFFTGEAANRAAAQDGQQEIPVPNDYYIRNVSNRLRTLRLAPAADVALSRNTLQDGIGGDPVPVTLAKLATYGPRFGSGVFWITVADAKVQRLEELYLP
jgi:hypothetical protein